MQHVKPTRWRAAPTLAVVLAALGLGAATARADAPPATGSTPAADVR
jgi:heme A synthase